MEFLALCLSEIIYLFLVVLGLRCCAGFSLLVESRGYSSAVPRLLVAVTSLVVEPRLRVCRLQWLQPMSSGVAVPGL